MTCELQYSNHFELDWKRSRLGGCALNNTELRTFWSWRESPISLRNVYLYGSIQPLYVLTRLVNLFSPPTPFASPLFSIPPYPGIGIVQVCDKSFVTHDIQIDSPPQKKDFSIWVVRDILNFFTWQCNRYVHVPA